MASPGIEPGSGASETLILSIVLQGQFTISKKQLLYYPRPNGRPGGHCTTRPIYYFKKNNSYTIPVRTVGRAGIVLQGQDHLANFTILLPNIFTAIASNITPKNFLTTAKPFGPKNLSIHFKDFKTRYITIQLIKMPIKILIST